MRVLVVHNRYRSIQPSGEDAVVDDEVALLVEHGCDVERLEVESDAIATWPAVKRAGIGARVVWSREGARLVRESVKRFGPDVVHFHNTFPLLSPAALRAAHATGVPVVQTLHNFRPLCPSADFLRADAPCEKCLGRLPLPAIRHGCYRDSRSATVPLAAMIAVHRLALTWRHAVDLYVTPSSFARSKYVAAGWDEEHIAVKANTAADPGVARAAATAGFVCLSRLTREKGVDILLDAFGRAFPEGEERLAVAGSGELEAELRSAAPDSVDFLGLVPRHEALTAVAHAHALVIPSRCYEVFPRTLVEAYALGVPVVAARRGALAELVEHERTGLLVEPESPAALAEALRRLAADTQLREDLGTRARAVYERSYAPGVTTDRLLAIYGRAIERRAARAIASVAEVADA